MTLKYFENDASDWDVIEALKQDGASVVLNQAPMEIIDAVNADFREPFDELGRLDEDDFNGYKTLRIGGVLGISHAAADLVEHPRVLAAADSVLMPSCENYRIGSLTGIDTVVPSTARWQERSVLKAWARHIDRVSVVGYSLPMIG